MPFCLIKKYPDFISSPKLKAVIFCIIASIVISSIIVSFRYGRTNFSDAYPSLIVSQSIIEHGAITMDPYAERLRKVGSIEERNGRLFAMHPIGPSIMAIPFVLSARLIGLDMLNPEHLNIMHMVMTAVVLSSVFVLMLAVSMKFLSFNAGFVLSAIFLFGSGYASTCMTEMTSHGYFALVVLSSILLIINIRSGRMLDAGPYLLGILLILVYLTRPIGMLFVISVLVLFLITDRKVFLISSLTFVAGMAVFMGLHSYAYGQILPSYYLPATHHLGKELDFEKSVPTALYGLMLSPSRGLLVFSPFLIVAAIGAVLYRREVLKNPLALAMISWFFIHYIAVAQFPKWWGEHGFGARYMTDALPAFFVIAVLAYHSLASAEISTAIRRTGMGAFIILGAFAIWIHVYQGLFNPWAIQWNKVLEIVREQKKSPVPMLMDWSSAQFLSSGSSLRKTAYRYMDRKNQCVKIKNDKSKRLIWYYTTAGSMRKCNTRGRLGGGFEVPRGGHGKRIQAVEP